MQNKFFNAHHSPVGAFASFTLGHKGRSGGFGLEEGRPADQNIYIGIETGKRGHFEALPFYDPSVDKVVTYGIEEKSIVRPKVSISPFDDDVIEREYAAEIDTWRAGKLSFTIYSPIPPIPDPDVDTTSEKLKLSIIPALVAEMKIDNRESDEEKRVCIGFTGDDTAGMRHIKNETTGMTGIAQGGRFAVCTRYKQVQSGIGFSAEEILEYPLKSNLGSGLGNTALLLISIPPRQEIAIGLSLCFFHDGTVTFGLEGNYVYRRFFNSISEVADYALDKYDTIKASVNLNALLTDARHLNDARSFMLTHAIRSYYGSTQLLDTAEGTVWVVYEGEYRMMNTLDLTVDQMFWELRMNPWTIRTVLDLYVKRYSYRDTLFTAGSYSVQQPGGIAFTHDMGVANVFSPQHYSVYERGGRSGCFSYMTHEQLLNWVLVASVYALHTGDMLWAESKKKIVIECLESLINRDNSNENHRKGLMQLESSRTEGGSEITTYDSLDSSLGRAKDNSYVAVKRWAAMLVLGHLFERLNLPDEATVCRRQADLTATTVTSAVKSDGTIPSLLSDAESGLVLPLVEGLIYPWFTNCRECFKKGSRYEAFIAALKRHFVVALKKGLCRGNYQEWKLSSKSDMVWLSKYYLLRFIATEIFQMRDAKEFEAADKVYASWLLEEKNSYFAWSDQFRNGTLVGSRYYPRGVTAVVWLMERVILRGDEK